MQFDGFDFVFTGDDLSPQWSPRARSDAFARSSSQFRARPLLTNPTAYDDDFLNSTPPTLFGAIGTCGSKLYPKTEPSGVAKTGQS